MPSQVQLSTRDITEILDYWFPNAPIIEPTHRGASNSTYFVSESSESFVLKLYGDSTSSEQIQYEHSLLAYLKQANLSFTVPAPILSKCQKTIVK